MPKTFHGALPLGVAKFNAANLGQCVHHGKWILRMRYIDRVNN